jgi:hypothetical protein
VDDFRIDIGRADKGRTFVRVVHLQSGKERTVIGLDGCEPTAVAERLQNELREELGIPKKQAKRFLTPSLGPPRLGRVLWSLVAVHILIVMVSSFTVRSDYDGTFAPVDEVLLMLTMLTSPACIITPLCVCCVGFLSGMRKSWIVVLTEVCVSIVHATLLLPLVQ